MNPALIDALPAWSGGPPATTARPLPTQTRWWQWPHLLGLDAPLVALVWQRWWARAAGVALPPSREIVLGLGVWLIYLLDRVADAKGCDPLHHGAARHVFSGRRRRLLRFLALFIASVLMVGTPRWLTGAEFRAGLILLALACGYFWLVHGWPDRGWAAYLPKEAMVGGMFAAGSVFFTACRSSHFPLTVWPVVMGFAVVCFLNCAYITRWERHARDLHERSSLLNAFPRLTAHLDFACALTAAAASGIAWVEGSVVAVPVAVSALLLAGLGRSVGRMSLEGLRVVADVVLLTPWIGLACLSPTV